MLNDAGCHEKRGFKRSMVKNVKHPSHHGQRLVQPKQQSDQTQMADGGVSEQTLQVMLEQRHVSTEHQSRQAVGFVERVKSAAIGRPTLLARNALRGCRNRPANGRHVRCCTVRPFHADKWYRFQH